MARLLELAAAHAVEGVVQALVWTFKASTLVCMPLASTSPDVACDPDCALDGATPGSGGDFCWGAALLAAAHIDAAAAEACGSGVWPAVTPFALALCSETALTLTLSPITVAEPLRAALRPGPALPFDGAEDVWLASRELVGTPPAWAAPVEACAQPRLSIAVSKWISMEIGA